ncbi:MAG: outer membrane lipoprotein LolB [Nitrosospira sp.]|nr:outer membrane lipoprotein LolB [Nitrosospira sp.]
MSKPPFFSAWLSLVLFVPPFIAGCAGLAQKDTVARTIITAPDEEMADARSADFSLIGRVSIKGGKESFSGGVQWRHARSGDEILLLAPLGQALAQIQSGPAGVHLTTSDRQSYHAADVESLTEQVLGWRLPLMGLQYWVQSMNSPATVAAIDMDMDGRVVTIRQDGWEIDYSGYSPALSSQGMEEPIVRPKLLLLKRERLQIKLVIDTWNPGNH